MVSTASKSARFRHIQHRPTHRRARATSQLIGAAGVGKSSVAQADVAHLSKQIELALFYDGKFDVAASGQSPSHILPSASTVGTTTAMLLLSTLPGSKIST
jgi:hypothetical protein